MKVAVCILAKNEAGSIAEILEQLSRQTLFAGRSCDITVHVVANGSSDATAAVARECGAIFAGSKAKLTVHDLELAGKSRAWNKTVHEIVDPSTEYLIFLDADINFVNQGVLTSLVNALQAHDDAAICTGYPIKDITAKASKSMFDAFSLAVSKRSHKPCAVNGSLYVARASALQDIWLPDQTPGEDGFLNAMVTTHGFTTPPIATEVMGLAGPTHYYEAHRPRGFFRHERRMIVGTMINIWIFEYLWSLRLTMPAGLLIRDWNEKQPDWVEKLIQERSRGRRWVIPNNVMFRRFQERFGGSWLKQVAYLPIAAAATVLTLPPALAANATLKRTGASSTW